jgi:hypothetical protein
MNTCERINNPRIAKSILDLEIMYFFSKEKNHNVYIFQGMKCYITFIMYAMSI